MQLYDGYCGRQVQYWSQFSSYQWKVLLSCFLGWVFDTMDGKIFAVAQHTALSELVAKPGEIGGSADDVAYYGGVILSMYLVGWAIGGVSFGVAADYYGRARVLTLTIIVYSTFTVASVLSRAWWHLGLCRFLTAIGTGGEWAAGASFVAEVWPREVRTRISSILQSAASLGYLLAALLNLALGSLGWRWLFAVAVLPAFSAVYVRRFVPEPEAWRQDRSRRSASGAAQKFTLVELFQEPQRRRDALLGAGMAFIAVAGFWGSGAWVPSIIRELWERENEQSIPPPIHGVDTYVTYAVLSLNVGSFLGYQLTGFAMERLGRRTTFMLWFACAGLSLPFTFLSSSITLSSVLRRLPIVGFFSNGIFTGFAIYFPELFPVHLRTTGAGFCFNVGRILAAIGPLVMGNLVVATGSYARAASTMGLVYVAGFLLAWFARETKGVSWLDQEQAAQPLASLNQQGYHGVGQSEQLRGWSDDAVGGGDGDGDDIAGQDEEDEEDAEFFTDVVQRSPLRDDEDNAEDEEDVQLSWSQEMCESPNHLSRSPVAHPSFLTGDSVHQ